MAGCFKIASAKHEAIKFKTSLNKCYLQEFEYLKKLGFRKIA